MKINNIITLVKAGYSPAEISSLDRVEDVLQMLNEGIKKEEIPALLELASDVPDIPPEETPETIKPSEEKKSEDDLTDYKVKYETLLKQTQKANTRQNIADDRPDNTEVITDIVKSFM